MTASLPPVELWSFRSFRATVDNDVDTELAWDWLAEVEEALVIDVSYSTPRGTARHAITLDWYDPTDGDGAARKVIAQTNDNAVFWNPVRWFVPHVPESTRRWVLRARCILPPPGTVAATLDVSVAIVRSAPAEET